MNSIVLIKKEFRENKVIYLVGLIILVVFAFLNAYLYEFLLKLMKGAQSADSPGFMKQSIDQMLNFNSYIWYSWFGKNYYQVLIVVAIIGGMGLIAGEVSRETIIFLLTKPYKRNLVYIVKYGVGAMSLFLIGLSTSLIQYIAILLSGKEYSLGNILLGVISSFPGILLIFSLAVLFSTLFNDRLKAGLSTGLITILLSIPGFFPKSEQYSIFKYITSASIINGEGFSWLPFLILLAFSTLLLLFGLRIFNKKQF